MTAALMLIALGMLALIICHGWWRNPDDLILTGLRKAAALAVFTAPRQRDEKGRYQPLSRKGRAA